MRTPEEKRIAKRAENRAYRTKHPENIKEVQKRYRKKHRGKLVAGDRKRRAGKKTEAIGQQELRRIAKEKVEQNLKQTQSWWDDKTKEKK